MSKFMYEIGGRGGLSKLIKAPRRRAAPAAGGRESGAPDQKAEKNFS
jgi:hypothetical protein